MFGTTRPSGELNGFLDRGSRIEGELRFEDTFRVEGQIRGTVSSQGSLVVGEGGSVEGTIAVAHLLVTGRVSGKVVARRVELAKGCRVEAEIETPALIIEEGAFFEGRCSMATPAAAEPARGTEVAADARGPRPVDLRADPHDVRRARKS